MIKKIHVYRGFFFIKIEDPAYFYAGCQLQALTGKRIAQLPDQGLSSKDPRGPKGSK